MESPMSFCLKMFVHASIAFKCLGWAFFMELSVYEIHTYIFPDSWFSVFEFV